MIYVDQDRVQWCDLENVSPNLVLPLTMENLLTSWEIISY